MAELGRAARETGFLYLSGHGIDPALFDRLLDAAKAFFARPVEEKMACWIGKSSNHRGYVPEGEEVFAGATADRKEAFDLSLELPDATGPLLGPNQWPAVSGFREPVTAWYDAVLALGHTLFGGFAEALGLPRDAFAPYLTRPTSQLRLIHYPYDPTAEDRPGIGAHTDYECFTLLRPTAPGLEVMNGAGEWIDAPPLDDCFVVNTGDLLELWTNGEFAATSHRVRKVTEERYSFPLFCTVDYDTTIAPLPAFTGPGRPRAPGSSPANTSTRRPSRPSAISGGGWPTARQRCPRGPTPLLVRPGSPPRPSFLNSVRFPSSPLRAGAAMSVTAPTDVLPDPPVPAESGSLLQEFGYRQELHRSLGRYASFAAGFSFISVLTTVFQFFAVGYSFGGPVFFWAWPRC